MTALPLSRRHLLVAGTGLAAAPSLAVNRPDWKALAADVKREMAWAWGHYRARAWGKDEIKPISAGASSFPLKDHHLGLTLIEALDTLWVMGLDSRFEEGLDWVRGREDRADTQRRAPVLANEVDCGRRPAVGGQAQV